MKAYLSHTETVLDELQTSESGLTEKEAASRLQKNGPNRLEDAKKESLIHRFLCQFAEPMTVILLIAALISGVLAIVGHEFPTDVIIIMAVVLLNAVLGVAQESKAEKAIDALQKIAAATSKVIRDGRQITLRSEDLVEGDIIILEAGDAVPADARILECASMKVEEAAMTGESVPSLKTSETLYSESGEIPLGDRKNMVFMGSTVVYGRGKAVIVNTGMNTQMGAIAGALSDARESKTPLQIKLAQLSRVLTKLVIVICVVIFGVNLARALMAGESFALPMLLDTFMVAVALAVAAIPEGLSTVVTIVLSIGVTNMSRRNAIIRRLTAVETLGCTQIICSDKTGTLTQNRMTVVEQTADDENRLANLLSLCSDAEVDPQSEEVIGEPTECALVSHALKLGLNKNHEKQTYPRVGEIPFDSMRKMMTTIHRTPSGTLVQYTKGAPDEVLRLCTHYYANGEVSVLDEETRSRILAQNKNMADRALRVLAGAQKDLDTLPDCTRTEDVECDLCFVGLVGMIDPVRPEVKPAIEQCRTAGIRPVMITGDHKDTALAIAMELGIAQSPDQALTGAELDAISDADFDVTKYSVYARVQPEHKTRIVKAWQDLGMVTAMTGDGVNDAPSIKNADIGVGMGITGTDVTKNVADMILTDDNFATIVTAAGEGRRIYDNIRRSIQFLLASNLSEVLSIFFATLLGFTLFRPVHLLWINLITDCLPALSLGMEKAENNIMNRAPRKKDEGIFSQGLGVSVVYQGLLVTVITLASYFIGKHVLYANHAGAPYSAESLGSSMAFLTLSMAEIFHAFNMRSLRGSIFRIGHTNLWLWGAAAVSLALTTAVVEIPFFAQAFSLAKLDITEYAVAIGLAICVIPIVELVKWIMRRAAKRRTHA